MAVNNVAAQQAAQMAAQMAQQPNEVHAANQLEQAARTQQPQGPSKGERLAIKRPGQQVRPDRKQGRTETGRRYVSGGAAGATMGRKASARRRRD